MYRCEYFALHELVPPRIYAQYGEVAWQFLDENELKSIDLLRDLYGPCYINNWFWGGNRQWSGLRTVESPYYSPTSQHTFGRATDKIFKSIDASTVVDEILKRPYLGAFKYINAVEVDVSWVHTDVRNVKRILQFGSA